MTATAGAVHALLNPVVLNSFSIQLTRILAAAIGMQNCPFEFRIGKHSVSEHLDTQGGFRVRIHGKTEYTRVKAIEER